MPLLEMCCYSLLMLPRTSPHFLCLPVEQVQAFSKFSLGDFMHCYFSPFLPSNLKRVWPDRWERQENNADEVIIDDLALTQGCACKTFACRAALPYPSKDRRFIFKNIA